jgi:hypothetical protein
MVKPQAAVVVLDHVPDSEEVADLAAVHLEEFPAEEAFAKCQITYEAPDFLSIGERDQIGAYLRDGSACVLVIYMSEGSCDDDEDDEE